MPRLPLQPGERELVRLRPGVGAFLPRYAGAMALGLWGVFLAFAPATWTGAEGQEWVVLSAAFLGPALAGAALYLPRRRMVRFVLCVGAGTVAVVVPIFLDGGGRTWQHLLWWTLAACSFVAFLLVETDRRLRTYRLTNLRVMHRGGLWQRKPWSLHYDAILDIDARQTPFGRLFNHGTLEPVLHDPPPVPLAKPTRRRKTPVPAMATPDVPPAKPRLWGVRPLRKVHRLLEAFVQDATATEYLRAEQQTQKRVGQAMRDLGRANLLR